MTQEPIVRMRGLVKHFGDVQALRGIDMDLPRGPVGLLGPNGAGKTTLIGLLLGLVEPTEGEASIAGLVPKSRADRIAIRKRVGYMPESDCLLPGMTGVELVSTLGKLTGLSREDAMTRAHEVLDYVELEEARYRPLDGYSTGMKQRLKLAQALVHDPELLLLDEPTNGLDPKGRRHMLSLVEDLGRNQGKNILLCSHLLPDVEKTCDHVVVVVKGRVALQGSIAELTAADEARVHVEVEERQDEFEIALRAAGMSPEKAPTKGLIVTVPDADDADAICEVAASSGFHLRGIDPVRSTLEQVFLKAVDGADVSATGSRPMLASEEAAITSP
ncbi:putative ABC transporter ATP-binding protein YxlF [Planctomycetes bacterium Poly30]|uniref:Putative ABC transporter ATP-binding protein YxlF n=1 Tax=Saltatorellus ferox TaxID=2528018 RepID=A0A518ETX4_9BACT|nr:putative ABC transporter ATP-binding protein YxlF [Planctomycetes bacterium Poly30]